MDKDRKEIYRDLDTKLVHAGEPSPRVAGAVALPVFQSATFEYSGEHGGGRSDYHDLRYIRLNNTPNHLALHEKLASLEGAEAALVTSSGMSAISTTLLALLPKGSHLLAQGCLYGGTHDLITRDFENFGIEFDFIESTRAEGQSRSPAAAGPEQWQALLRPNTKAVYVETIANPLMTVPDLEAVVAFARQNNLVSIIDNTFASPVNLRPAELGFDISLHSCTKYINGHSDIVAGACIGSAALIAKIKHLLDHLGGCLDPHAAFLLHRGMKTLALRVRQQNESACALAHFLESHSAVAKVNYPGLASHESHERASKYLDGFGGMLSFELKEASVEAADRFMAALKLPISAPSLGGVESLITRPATTSHAGLTRQDRAALGIAEHLIRFSTGIESRADLIADFEQAFKSVFPQESAARSAV